MRFSVQCSATRPAQPRPAIAHRRSIAMSDTSSASSEAKGATNIAQFLAAAFRPEQIAQWQADSQDEDLSENGAFKCFVVPFSRGERSDLGGCTYRHVVKFLDTDEALTDHEWRTASFDWFSSNEQARAIKAKGVPARQHAQALAQHKSVAKAEKALLA